MSKVKICLGQTQTVRRIKKLVLDGTETLSVYTLSYPRVPISFELNSLGIQKNMVMCLCTHFIISSTTEEPSFADIYTARLSYDGSRFYMMFPKSFFDEPLTEAGAKTKCQEFLAQQYANGTPVCVWYVLETPETAIVNEPLCKIGTYTDELHSEDAGVSIPTVKGQNTLTVDTELQPSEMTITYFEEV